MSGLGGFLGALCESFRWMPGRPEHFSRAIGFGTAIGGAFGIGLALLDLIA
jgi:hypothetical protein